MDACDEVLEYLSRNGKKKKMSTSRAKASALVSCDSTLIMLHFQWLQLAHWNVAFLGRIHF